MVKEYLNNPSGSGEAPTNDQRVLCFLDGKSGQRLGKFILSKLSATNSFFRPSSNLISVRSRTILRFRNIGVGVFDIS